MNVTGQSWEIQKVSEDVYDYSRDNYDYEQLELLNDQFRPAPPISVAEYKARTLDKLPQGIFDESEVPGILIKSKEIRYCGDADELIHGSNLEPYFRNSIVRLDDQKKQQTPSDSAIPQNQRTSPVSLSQTSSKVVGKKKKKFKKFEWNANGTDSGPFNVPFVPVFPNKNRDIEFPNL